MSRRVSLVVVLGIVSALVLATGLTAGAAQQDVNNQRTELRSAQERLAQVRQDAVAAQNAYNGALYELVQVDAEIEETEGELNEAQERLSRARGDLEERASQVYKSGNVGFMDVLVGVDDFSNFSSRVDLWLDLLAQERSEFEKVRQARDDLQAKKDQLESQRAERVETTDAAVARKDAAAEAEAEAESYLNSLSEELQASIQAEQAERAERARAAAEALREEFAAKVAAAEAQEIEEQRAAEEAELRTQRRAARQQAAEQRAAELAEAERQAQLAAEREAAREQEAAEQAAREEARQQAAAQRAAERRARRLAVQQEAAELAAQQAAAQEAAELEAQQVQAAEDQYAQEQAVTPQAASETPSRAPGVPEPAEESVPANPDPVPQPAPAPSESVVVQGGVVAPHVQAFADEACRQVGACAPSTYVGHQPSTELALDFLVADMWGVFPASTTLGDAVASFALNNSGAYSIDYVIWGNLIAGSWTGYQWVNYGGNGATEGHYDHVHVGFLGG